MNKLRAINVIFLCCLIFVNTNCGNRETQKTINYAPRENREITSKYVISKETAVLIAKGATCSDYNFKFLDEIVIDEQKNWKVTFDFKPGFRNLNGGAPTVVVDKTNGRVVFSGGTK